MICKECNTKNKENYKFCVNCGKEFKSVKKELKESKVDSKKALFISVLKDLKEYLLKPLDALNNKSKYDIKELAIVGSVICFTMVIINLIKKMILTVRVTEFDWLKGSVYVWRFDKLKDLDYFTLIFKNFFLYVAIILALAFIFYLGTLIIKKEVRYEKIVLISFISIIPFILGNMIVSSLVGLMFAKIGVLVSIVCLVYTIALFIMLINEEVKLKGYKKLIFNVMCFSTIICLSYLNIININLLNLI